MSYINYPGTAQLGQPDPVLEPERYAAWLQVTQHIQSGDRSTASYKNAQGGGIKNTTEYNAGLASRAACWFRRRLYGLPPPPSQMNWPGGHAPAAPTPPAPRRSAGPGPRAGAGGHAGCCPIQCPAAGPVAAGNCAASPPETRSTPSPRRATASPAASRRLRTRRWLCCRRRRAGRCSHPRSTTARGARRSRPAAVLLQRRALRGTAPHPRPRHPPAVVAQHGRSRPAGAAAAGHGPAGDAAGAPRRRGRARHHLPRRRRPSSSGGGARVALAAPQPLRHGAAGSQPRARPTPAAVPGPASRAGPAGARPVAGVGPRTTTEEAPPGRDVGRGKRRRPRPSPRCPPKPRTRRTRISP